jgi:hypothetical protein
VLPEEDAVDTKRYRQDGVLKSPEAIGAFFLPQKGASCPDQQQDIVAATHQDTLPTSSLE